MAGRDGSAELGLIVASKEDLLTRRLGDVSRCRPSADDMVRIRLGGHVRDEDVRCFGKVGLNGNADQAAFPVRIDRQPDERLREQRPVFDDPKRSGLLGDEGAAVIGDLQRSWPVNSDATTSALKPGGSSSGPVMPSPGVGASSRPKGCQISD